MLAQYASELIFIVANDATIKTATKIATPKITVRVTRRLKPLKSNRRNEYVVTIGEPNYLALRFIKLCKKAGEPFPVKKIQLNYIKKTASK